MVGNNIVIDDGHFVSNLGTICLAEANATQIRLSHDKVAGLHSNEGVHMNPVTFG
jgi:hypothetical protein